MTEREPFVDGPVGGRTTIPDDDPMRSDPVFQAGYEIGKRYIAIVIASDGRLISDEGVTDQDAMLEAAAWGYVPESLLEKIAVGVHPDGQMDVRRRFEAGIVVAVRDHLGWAPTA